MKARLALASLLAILVTLSACGSEEPAGSAGDDPAASPLAAAFQGLCEAETLAESGDAEAAADVFLSRSHGYIHELADRLSTLDRVAAAELLEAKQRLEAPFRDPASSDPSEVSALVADLQREVAEGAEVVGMPRPACDGGR